MSHGAPVFVVLLINQLWIPATTKKTRKEFLFSSLVPFLTEKEGLVLDVNKLFYLSISGNLFPV